ncbi:MAG TPA: T9SS type A sorting domain-containing protein [Flavisolibacter sp.]
MKKFLLIVSIILLTTVHSEAQTNTERGAQAGTILRSYPNPATTSITFDFQRSFEKGYSIQVYNLLGKKMVENANVNDRTTIDLSAFTRGVYIYQLRDKTGRIIESGKFQVSK